MSTEWVQAIAESVGREPDEVAGVLESYGISGRKPIPARRRLRIEALHFAGVKNLQDTKDKDSRVFVPYSFARAFDTSITAFVSNERNDVGKSSILEMLKWGFRGTNGLSDDVRKWMRQACVLLQLGDEHVVVAWRISQGEPTGWILTLPDGVWPDLVSFRTLTLNAMSDVALASQQNGAPVYLGHAPIDDLVAELRAKRSFVARHFSGAADMKLAIGDFMLQRLHLDASSQWTRFAGATEDDDGRQNELGWPLWSQALVINKPSVKAVIGEVPNQTIAVLNTFLATEWSATRNAARVNRKALDARLAGVRRRRERDRAARESGASNLRDERALVEAELNSLAVGGMSTDDAIRVVRVAEDAAAEMTRTQLALTEAAHLYGAAERALQDAELDLVAAKEAAVTKRFWHSLKPACCPRCDARVEAEQWSREQEGACSMCNKPITEEQLKPIDRENDAESVEDDLDPVELGTQLVSRLGAEREALSLLHDEAVDAVRRAKLNFELASNAVATVHGDPVRRQTLERRLGYLDGRIEERVQPVDPAAEEEDGLFHQARVLAAAETFASKAVKEDFDEALAAVSEQVTALGKQLGISNLEKATLKGNAQLPVIKGGEESHFGSLPDGEKLRLRVALVVALLDVGSSSGLGRHPGLLIIDSLASEELNAENAKLVLGELERVAADHELQIITSTAHSDLVSAVLPPEAIQGPVAGKFMW